MRGKNQIRSFVAERKSKHANGGVCLISMRMMVGACGLFENECMHLV